MSEPVIFKGNVTQGPEFLDPEMRNRKLSEASVKRTPVRKFRAGLRRGELTSAQKGQVRLDTYLRAEGWCEIHGDEHCIRGPFYRDDVQESLRGHLVHLRNKRMWGWGPENVCWGCAHCHLELVHQGKLTLPKTYSELAAWREQQRKIQDFDNLPF